jgi:hypothetical protein
MMNVAEEAEKRGGREIASIKTVPQANARKMEVVFYENQIPDFVGNELERLYESVYCTLARFNIYHEAYSASTYVARSGGVIQCLILFRIESGVVRVINQQIKLADDDIRCFADAVFAKYRKARRIAFYAIDTTLERCHLPFQRYQALEENVLTLPRSRDEYTASLNQNLLKRLQAGERKLKRDYPEYQFQILKRTEVTEQILRQVVEMASARMAAKQQSAYLREEDIGKILALIHRYGFVGVLRIDGAIRGGNIFYGVGRRYFMHVIAHDPDYDKYMPGHMVQYLAACYCIDAGGSECCLMGGGRENKGRFRAFPKYLDSVDIYRSRLAVLRDARRVASGSLRRLAHRLREDFLQLSDTDTPAGRRAARVLTALRALKKGWRRGAGDAK